MSLELVDEMPSIECVAMMRAVRMQYLVHGTVL